jgi:hypothetical protein
MIVLEYCSFCRLYEREISVRQLDDCIYCHDQLKKDLADVSIIENYKFKEY